MLNDTKKALIVKGYTDGTPLKVISSLIGKPIGTIKSFHSRWKAIQGLPPKEKKSRTRIKGRLGLAIKNITSENSRLSSRKIARKLVDSVPEGQY
jgi:hypothetical protein